MRKLSQIGTGMPTGSILVNYHCDKIPKKSNLKKGRFALDCRLFHHSLALWFPEMEGGRKSKPEGIMEKSHSLAPPTNQSLTNLFIDVHIEMAEPCQIQVSLRP